MDRATQHVSVSTFAAVVFTGDRFTLSRFAGPVRPFAIALHAYPAIGDSRRRPALAGFLYWIHADRLSYLRGGVHAGTTRRLVAALAAAAATFLLSPDDVRGAVPRGDGGRSRQVSRMARRRTGSS